MTINERIVEANRQPNSSSNLLLRNRRRERGGFLRLKATLTTRGFFRFALSLSRTIDSSMHTPSYRRSLQLSTSAWQLSHILTFLSTRVIFTSHCIFQPHQHYDCLNNSFSDGDGSG